MNVYIVFLFCVLFSIPLTILVYLILPKINHMIYLRNNKLHQDATIENIIIKKLSKIPFPAKLKRYLVLKLFESGLGDQNTWIYWIGLTFIFPGIMFLILSIQKYSIGTKFAFCALCFVLPNMYLKSQIEKRKRAFIINAYKLYYFLHSQISSGIKVTDAIKGLYEIADHPLIQKTFIQFVAQYELTLNIEESLQVLKQSFSGYDCEMLCVSIQQCVNTGMAGRTLLKMEQLMFAKYFYNLQKDTEKFKTKLLISGLFAIAPIIMIFLFPMLNDALKAFGTILKN